MCIKIWTWVAQHGNAIDVTEIEMHEWRLTVTRIKTATPSVWMSSSLNLDSSAVDKSWNWYSISLSIVQLVQLIVNFECVDNFQTSHNKFVRLHVHGVTIQHSIFLPVVTDTPGQCRLHLRNGLIAKRYYCCRPDIIFVLLYVSNLRFINPLMAACNGVASTFLQYVKEFHLFCNDKHLPLVLRFDAMSLGRPRTLGRHCRAWNQFMVF